MMTEPIAQNNSCSVRLVVNGRKMQFSTPEDAREYREIHKNDPDRKLTIREILEMEVN